MDAISEASKNVSILLNRKLQMAPVFIKSVRKQDLTSAVPKDQNQYSNADVVNVITTYEIWKVFLEYDKTKQEDCFVILSGDYTLQGYKNGVWSNVKYCGFHSLLEEAENEIMGYLK